MDMKGGRESMNASDRQHVLAPRDHSTTSSASINTELGVNEQGKMSTHRYQCTRRMSPSTTVRVGMYYILPTRVLNMAERKEDTARADMCESEHQGL